MNNIAFGIIAGLVFGAIDAALMIPMSFPDKKTAIEAYAPILATGIIEGAIIGALAKRFVASGLLSSSGGDHEDRS